MNEAVKDRDGILVEPEVNSSVRQRTINSIPWEDMNETQGRNDSIVAALREKSPNPFSSISLSPSGQFAVVAEKDTLQLIRIDPSRITSLRKFNVSQHFQGSVPKDITKDGKRYVGVRDTFKLGVKQPPHSHGRNIVAHGNVIITTVAWSPPQNDALSMTEVALETQNEEVRTSEEADGSLVAAAGSNGAIAIWNAKQAFFSEGSGGSSTVANQQPEAVLSQEHTRAINCLAWHPKRRGVLLSASQDATAKLWERREITTRRGMDAEPKNILSFFSRMQTTNEKEYSWLCKSTFEPKCDAIREIQWSKQQDDVSGSLVVYNMHITWKSLVKIAAHAGEATSCDWHPTRTGVIATGGSSDRCVKVWNIENSTSLRAEDNVASTNANTWNTTKSEVSTSSNDTEKSIHSVGAPSTAMILNASNSTKNNSFPTSTNRYKSMSKMTEHIITVGSSVVKVRWRPPSFDSVNPHDEGNGGHESMLAVATAQLTGAGGSGIVSLYSTQRIFMPLSVLGGHTEGAVADFEWIHTFQHGLGIAGRHGADEGHKQIPCDSKVILEPIGDKSEETLIVRSGGRGDVESVLFDNQSGEMLSERKIFPTWHRIVSVGRDGHCLLQSFALGERPIEHVPSSCFGIANLPPRALDVGVGSLQIFSAYQKVPIRAGADFDLTDSCTDKNSVDPLLGTSIGSEKKHGAGSSSVRVERIPSRAPRLIYNVVDLIKKDVEDAKLAVEDVAVFVSPEVIHLSTFAALYRLYPDSTCPSCVDLCLHNSTLAKCVNCTSLSQMWRNVAGMLGGLEYDDLPSKDNSNHTSNVMHFVIFPSLRSLLLERADAGDVQTCVALCEVLRVIEPNDQIRIPGLSLKLVREWYLSYIDLLQSMRLFSAATYLIRSCNDHFIRALNQQSTTIHESCTRCGKALPPASETGTRGTARRLCQNCRRRVGLCFLCHEPVEGVYVWCAGCGHGGHIQHALQWFGGSLSGEGARNVCPTGCGHRCNLLPVGHASDDKSKLSGT